MIEACAVCDADWFFSSTRASGGGGPIFSVAGREIIGTVAAIGNDVQHWKVGDCIGAGRHRGQDDTYEACKKGWKQICENQMINRTTKNKGV